jgi:hypothetical protein
MSHPLSYSTASAPPPTIVFKFSAPRTSPVPAFGSPSTHCLSLRSVPAFGSLPVPTFAFPRSFAFERDALPVLRFGPERGALPVLRFGQRGARINRPKN